MVSIQASQSVHTVIVTVDADPPLLVQLRAHAEGGLERVDARGYAVVRLGGGYIEDGRAHPSS